MVSKSIRTKQILAYSLLILLAYGGMTFYLIQKIHQSFLSTTRNYILREVETLAIIPLQNDGPNGISLQYKQLLDNSSSILQARLTLINPEGQVIYDTNADPNEMDNHLGRPEIQAALKGTPSTQIRTSQTLGIDMVYAAAPIIDLENGGIEAIIRLAVSISDLQRAISPVVNIIIAAAGLSATIMIILAVFISESFTRPIRSLTNTIKKFHTDNLSDLSEISPVHRKDEIGQLDIAFRIMAIQLAEQIVQLKREQSTLSAVLSHMTDAVVIVNADGSVAMMNPAAVRIFKVKDPDASDLTLMKVVRQHEIVELWHRSRELLEQQSSAFDIEPGSHYLQAIATPLDPTIPGYTLIVFQDLTRIRQLEIVRRDFVSNVSHELRTPLASLKAISETLMEGALEDTDAARRFLGRMDDEIDNMTQLVRELLELSRIESGRVPLVIKSIPPSELVVPAAERMQIQANRSGLVLQVDYPKDLPQVLADPDRIEEVLVNLIHNAIKFTLPGGSIFLTVAHEGSLTKFMVRDTGIGIPQENLSRVFERFYKADKARSSSGTGLGLSIARHIIESHSGQIWAESQPGTGSTFYFTLPTSDK